MHRYLARFIACALFSAGFFLSVFFTSRTNGTSSDKNQIKITVRADGATSDIVGAIEALRREDVSIHIRRAKTSPPYSARLALSLLAGAGMLWVVCGIVKRTEQAFTRRKQENRPAPPDAGA
ncbi:MAG: hypothetical protein LBI02_12390 [Opitutaceae bacterium]|jgi:hypothetical protein|nr:hypothetical protein [Opitutaceae bacterium]